MPDVPLQSLIWPDPTLCPDPDLWLRLHGDVALDADGRGLQFGAAGGWAGFDTYGNLFNLARWQEHCDLSALQLRLQGSGQLTLEIFEMGHPPEVPPILERQITLEPGQPLTLDLPLDQLATDAEEASGLLAFVLRATAPAQLTAADWISPDAAQRQPDMLLVITSFRRPEALQASLSRFATYLQGSQISGHLQLAVIDNDQSLRATGALPPELLQHPQISVIENENLGGAGGFARGAMEAQARAVSHCLFMDDDAAIPMAALERTWSFLAHARDPATAVAGALAESKRPWCLWENGALFDRICRPQQGGIDLRDPGALTMLEQISAQPRPDNFYGGWWYFAFPIAEMRHLPFPFFVRGDDVSFSLVHDFNIVTLNGVMAHQDEDFTRKESPLTVYLDLRSHLAHHLALPNMRLPAWKLGQIMLRFHLRSFLNFHYESLEAIAIALEDVLRGPEFFAAEADLRHRRADFACLTEAERWQPAAPGVTAEEAPKPPPRWMVLAMKLTLNGYLLPGFDRFGATRVLPARLRGNRRLVWGAAHLTYVTQDGQCYHLHHDKRRGFALTRRIAAATWQLLRHKARHEAEWQAGYKKFTTGEFWRARLGLASDTQSEQSEPASKSA